jgi:predicted DNA-binding ribbon-helix-helix protein
MTRIGSLVIKRSIVRDGHKSSVSPEDQFWDALREIAGGKNMTVSALVATFDHGGNRDNLSSAIRVFVLDHFRRSSEHTPAGRPNQTPLPHTCRCPLCANSGHSACRRPDTFCTAVSKITHRETLTRPKELREKH